ncbi:MAG: cell division ATP-binding protein FtsE [Candidatus Schekmanbacteria bacterium]|nr:cell division ATP-binding protein FtsE [Candidatus Schekmanbacteria bacterium]
MIQLFHVNKVYDGGLWALRDISLSVKKGEFVFLTGPSGAGKTTLLKLLYMAETLSDGQVVIFGKNTSRLKKRSIPYFRRNIGVVFQDFKLLRDSNVFDNVAFALRILGRKHSEINGRVMEVLRMVGLEKRYRDVPENLSGGEQQRVCIARAIVNSPALLLADEPSGNLDPENAARIIDIFNQVNAKGSTVIVATHNVAMVRELGKRTLHIDNGKIREDSTGRESDVQ